MLDTLRRRRDSRIGWDGGLIEAKFIRRIGYALGVSILFVAAALTPGVMDKKAPPSATKCEHIEGRGDPCKFVRDNCGNVAHAVDYLRLMYCDGVGSSPSANPLVVVGLVLWLLMLLSLLGKTAEFFFTEQLDYASRRLGLSDDVAGATLMALGNGAPDVFTAWNAIHQASDLPLVLAELLGASIFITTVVLGAVILASSSITVVQPKPFARDVTMLSASAFAVACFCLDGVVDFVESTAIIVLYAGYVGVVVCSRTVSYDNDSGEDEGGSPLMVPDVPRGVRAPLDWARRRPAEVELVSPTEAPVLPPVRRGSAASMWDDTPEGDAAEDRLLGGTADDALSLRGVSCDATTPYDRVVLIAEWPFAVLRHASIPPATFDPRRWNADVRRLSATSCLGAAAVIAFDAAGCDVRAMVTTATTQVFIVGGFLLGLITYCRTSDKELPPQSVRDVLVCVAFCSTVAWLDLLASETVAVLETVGAAMGLSSAVLGVTALAWGNCIGDLVADTVVARAGNPQMAVASVFNSPVFSQAMALGVPVAVYTRTKGPLAVDLTGQVILSFAVLAGSLLATAAVAARHDSSLPRRHAFALFALYGAYMAGSVAFELRY